MVESPAIPSCFECHRGRDLVVNAKVRVVLCVGLQSRSRAFFRCAASGAGGRPGAVVDVLQEVQSTRRSAACESGLTGGVLTLAVPVVAVIAGNDARESGCVQCIPAFLPILAAVRTDGHVQLHLIEVFAVAAEYLHLPILEDIPRHADTRSDFVSPAEVDRPGDLRGRGLVLSRQILALDAQAGVDGDALPQRPAILGKQAVVEADGRAAAAEVVHVHGAVLAHATVVLRCTTDVIASRLVGHICVLDRCAIVHAYLPLRIIGVRGAGIDLNKWRVVGLEDGVGVAVQLVAELEVVGTTRAGVEPGHILIELDGLVGVVVGKVLVNGLALEAAALSQSRRQGSAIGVCVARCGRAAGFKEISWVGGRVPIVVVVLKVVAEPRGGYQGVGKGDIRTRIQRHIGRRVADVVSKCGRIDVIAAAVER